MAAAARKSGRAVRQAVQVARMLTTFELVTALGGPAAVADELGMSLQAVCNWYARDPAQIPARHHLPLWSMAKRAGLSWRPPGAEGWDLVRIAPRILPAPAPREVA